MSSAHSILRILTLTLFAGLSLPLAAQTQTPFGAMPIPVPGTTGIAIIEAENFDNGGEGVAYRDNVAGNAGGQYRTAEDVDIIVSKDAAGGGYVVNNFDAGEWLEYTVDIAAAGQYEIAVRASSNWTSTPRFHVELDGVDITGSVDVKLTGSWGTFAWNVKRGVSLPAGQHVLRLVSDTPYFDVNQIRVTATPTTPFAGVIPLPGIIEAENYDNGGQDVSYSDTTATNDGGQFRNDGVDLIVSRDPDDAGAGYSVNNFRTGEWLAYTVSVATTGLYDIETRVATGDFANAALHIEIDGVNVSGSLVPGATGSFGTYQWVKKASVWLTAGQHVLKLVSDQEFVDVNRIRVTAVTHTPFSGTPIPLPGTFEAEDFDRGGEGNAYHDNVAGNAGGQYRTAEDVDIIVSKDAAGGGYVVNNFDADEWLAYTVDIAAAGLYDIAVRASSNWTSTPRFHVELDGVDITGSVDVKLTGSWGTFDWNVKPGVLLPAGRHVLRLVSDTPYFDVNQIRVEPSAAPRPRPQALLFHSGFEGTSSLGPLDSRPCDGANCYQDVLGTDSETGFSWPPQLPGGGSSKFKLRAGNNTNPTPATISNYMVNEIQSVTGPKRTPTRAQYSIIKQNCFGRTGGQEGCSTQDTYMVQPTSEPSPDMYISFWRRLQPNLVEKFQGADKWHMVFEWKTIGDLRVKAEVVNHDAGLPPYWQTQLDNVADGGLPFQRFWRCPDDGPDVCGAGKIRIPPLGEWFKFEVFWHRSTGSDGRIWMAVNGTVIVDHRGPNKAVDPINRIMFMQLYSGAAYPVEQWTDDIQIWSKVPVEGVDAKPGDPWYDRPYGLK